MANYDYEYIIIGSGIAGLSVALNAGRDGQRVLIVTKTHLEESNTRYAQGGIAAAVAQEDSPQSHKSDTLIAGAGLANATAVEVLTADAPARIDELVQLGVAFDREDDGRLELGREGAHSANRILHAGGDATGWHIEHGLAEAVRACSTVEVLEEHFATELTVENGRVVGVTLLTLAGTARQVRGRFIIIASGGAGQLYRYTTNPAVTTGDGIALAWRAGAMLADMEFFQFHPTALNLNNAPTFLISEAVRGDGAILRNSAGRAFMLDYDSRAELASRDIVSRAIADEMAKTGGAVYLDATNLGETVVKHRFPSIYRFCLEHGLDMASQPIPVSPAAHYFMGGIATGLNGETTLPGLLACGEAASTGVHGANRLASNSLLEGLVFGRRVYDYTRGSEVAVYNPAQTTDPALPAPLILTDNASDYDWAQVTNAKPEREQVQALMWANVGLSRDAAGLHAAINQLVSWEKTLAQSTTPSANRAELELQNLVTIGRLMAQAALQREESRGAHYRRDFPQAVEQWQRRIFIKAS